MAGDRAWAIRDAWLAGRGGDDALGGYEAAQLACGAVTGLGDDRAWQWRKAARTAAPVAAIASLWNLYDERAWAWRHQALARAPKPVLASIDGCDLDAAWELRERTVARCPEALDSMRGQDGPRAWALRHAAAQAWPAAVVKSLGLLLPTEAGKSLLAAQLVRFPDHLGLWRAATQAVTRGAVDLDE